MIDLSVAIRSHIFDNLNLLNLLPDYQGSKTVFTRRPVPTDAPFPMILISPLVADNQIDFLRCGRSVLTYDIAVYGKNDNPTNYRNVEKIANELQSIFHRMPNYSFSLTDGYKLIRTTARSPIQAPVDDDKTIGRVVICNFDLSY